MIIIPARLKSSRFENKILTKIDGLEMVIRTAKRVEGLDDICIATDSEEVLNLAIEYGFNAVMTDINHTSGTDRINEAAGILGLADDEIVINVQADEPYIERDIVEKIINETKRISHDNNTLMVSCYKKINSEAADDPNHVKVVVGQGNEALYFSRSKIPHHRDHHDNSEYFGHLGIYGFTTNSLRTFCSYEESTLEQLEKLEQLRALSNGKKVKMIEVQSKSFGIDTEEDLRKLESLIDSGDIK